MVDEIHNHDVLYSKMSCPGVIEKLMKFGCFNVKWLMDELQSMTWLEESGIWFCLVTVVTYGYCTSRASSSERLVVKCH